MDFNYEVLMDKITKATNLTIYGAGIIAYGIYQSLFKVYGILPTRFVVTNKESEGSDIEGIPIITVNELPPVNRTDLILISTPEAYHSEIITLLQGIGFTNNICVSSELEYNIMSEYYRKIGRFYLLEDMIDKQHNLVTGYQSPDLGVYMAECHVDTKLTGNYKIPSWIKPIQVGASLTETRITNITDNTKDNISFKNRNYSELTATYWAWKNTTHRYKGICHYRRLLVLSENQIGLLASSNIDVILPLPFVCMNNTSEQYGRYIGINDFHIAMNVLKKISPDYYIAAQSILTDHYIYNYNMLIAKQKVFDDYCKWMFPILAEIEKICEPPNKSRNDRYIGYIGEILTALYFLYNKNGLNIAHVMKKWLV